jgi:hypothetical protein
MTPQPREQFEQDGNTNRKPDRTLLFLLALAFAGTLFLTLDARALRKELAATRTERDQWRIEAEKTADVLRWTIAEIKEINNDKEQKGESDE